MTKNEISVILTKEIAKQVNKFNRLSDKVTTILSDAILITSEQTKIKPSEIISMFGMSNIRKMLPISFYRELGYTK
jgi:hypothetical protein